MTSSAGSVPNHSIARCSSLLYRASCATMQPNQIEAYTDGQCNLCRWMRARVAPLDRDRRIEWLDYNDPEILQRAAPHTREEMAEEMHTRTADGRWSKGYFAWIEVIRVLPRWKWLSPILSVWPFTKFGPIFYGWLAARRYTVFCVSPFC